MKYVELFLLTNSLSYQADILEEIINFKCFVKSEVKMHGDAVCLVITLEKNNDLEQCLSIIRNFD